MRVMCIDNKRPDMGSNIPDPFIRQDTFYTVVREQTPAPYNSGIPWILIRCEETGEEFARPRNMFGPIIYPDTIS